MRTDRSKVWKLKTAVYGLGDAAREWYLTVKQTLLSLGLKESKLEPSPYFKTSESGQLEGILCLHVDDIFLAGNRRFKGITEMLKEKIKTGKHKRSEFIFCGRKFTQERQTKTIHVGVDPSKLNQLTAISVRGPPDRALTEREETQARSLIGTMQWYASICRPDLSYSFGIALSFLSKDRKIAVFELINAIIVKFAKFPQNRLTFQTLKRPINIEVYGDTSLDGDNQQGLITLMREEQSEKANMISWRSRQ